MSILIKGAKMPKDCPMCPLSHWNKLDEFTGCEVVNGKRFAVTNDKGYAQSNTRPSWCPLVEIPPHGRLIDADALKTKLNNIHDFLLGDCEFSELATSDKARIDELTNCIAEVVNAPTVIESEE